MSFQENAWEGNPPKQQESVSGWSIGAVVFAGTLMIISGLFQIFQGLAAILQDDFFVLTRSYAFDLDVTTWGWIHLIGGILILIAGWSLFSGATWARVVGITLALLSAIANFASIPYQPFWSILIIVLDVIVIWALAVYGGALGEGQAG